MENLFKYYDELSLEDSHYWRFKCENPPDDALAMRQKHLDPSDGTFDGSGSTMLPQDAREKLQTPTAELMWSRSKKPFSWAYRILGSAEWQYSSTTLLEHRMIALGVSADHLKRDIISNIMTQIVHAQMMVEAGEKLLGADVLGQAFTQTKEFLDSIQAMADTIVPKTSERLNALKGSVRSAPPKKALPKLRLVNGVASTRLRLDAERSVAQPDLDLDVDLEHEF